MSEFKCREVEITPPKTYATKANMERALAKYPRITENADLTYLVIQTPEGRWYPIFLGERAIQAGVHFAGFCVAG